MDLLSFRDLYGMMTEEKRQELAAIQQQVGLKAVRSEDAEAALFGDGAPVEAAHDQGAGFDEFAGADLRKTVIGGRPVHDTPYTQQDIDRGIALNAALILEDPGKIHQTQAAVQQAITDSGLRLQVVDWQTASGLIGQMVVLVRVVLYVAILIIFLVAVVIINNTMVLATMERVIEIGTIRAIGGQKGLVRLLFLAETLLLGLVSGALGALLGAGAVSYLGKIGIPAVADVLVFLFSGPRLYPSVGPGNLVFAAGVILTVSLAATFYPAFVATRIQPVVAMQARE
jgi:ABC-type lipoprotein release transport system permease subunit